MRKATLKLDKHPTSALGWSYDIFYDTRGGNKGTWGDGYKTITSARRAARAVGDKLGLKLQEVGIYKRN